METPDLNPACRVNAGWLVWFPNLSKRPVAGGSRAAEASSVRKALESTIVRRLAAPLLRQGPYLTDLIPDRRLASTPGLDDVRAFSARRDEFPSLARQQRTGRHAAPGPGTCRCQRMTPPQRQTGPRLQTRWQPCACSIKPNV